MVKKEIEDKQSGDDPDAKLREARERRWDAERDGFLNCPPSPEIETEEQWLDKLEGELVRFRIVNEPGDDPRTLNILSRNHLAKTQRMLLETIRFLRRRVVPGPPVQYAELMKHVETEMKGYEQALAKAVINSGGKLWIPALIQQIDVDWPEKWGTSYDELQYRVNKKLAKWGYALSREGNHAVLNPIPDDIGIA